MSPQVCQPLIINMVGLTTIEEHGCKVTKSLFSSSSLPDSIIYCKLIVLQHAILSHQYQILKQVYGLKTAERPKTRIKRTYSWFSIFAPFSDQAVMLCKRFWRTLWIGEKCLLEQFTAAPNKVWFICKCSWGILNRGSQISYGLN